MDTQLLAHLQSYLTDRRRSLFEKVLSERTRHFTVVTEDVYQIHNTSAVMRSCDIFGVQDLHVIEERLGKKVDREIAMGAQKWVNIHRHNNTAHCVKNLREDGYQIIATTPHNDSQVLSDFDPTAKTAFFFGKENDGISDYVMNTADGFLKIPMFGFTESLNISVSAAIILQETMTKLKASSVDWRLSEEEKNELRLAWTRKTIKSAEEIEARYYQKNK
ncbi:MAG: RNA methyltransferase [Bacteroidetes bacterium]|nr:RNA methyltransferase [Bacteroidota bacterium]